MPRCNSTGLELAQPFSVALDGGQRLEESSRLRRPLQPARESFLRQSPPNGNVPCAARICRNRRRFISLPRGPARPRASEPRFLDAATCTYSRNSLGGGVTADRRTDIDLLARILEVRRTLLSLLLPRFGPRNH